MAGVVRCADCGFLGVRNTDTRDIWDAEESFRDTGEIPQRQGFQRGIYDDHPLCFVRAFDLRKELNALGPIGSPQRKKVVQELRECKPFTEWHQGFTPKEHQEMLDRQWAEKQETNRRWWDNLFRAINLAIVLSVPLAAVILASRVNPPPTVIVNIGEPSVPPPAPR